MLGQKIFHGVLWCLTQNNLSPMSLPSMSYSGSVHLDYLPHQTELPTHPGHFANLLFFETNFRTLDHTVHVHVFPVLSEISNILG